MFFTGIFYILFGQGGNLLALRAKSDRNEEKSNLYFTISFFGIIIVSLIYILAIAFFSDSILHLFNTPAEIYDITKEYLFVIILFYPLNCFVVTLSYFVRADGFPRLPFYAVLIANVANIIFDIIFLEVLGMGIVGTAWASAIGYSISVLYISTYFFRKERSFKFINSQNIKKLADFNCKFDYVSTLGFNKSYLRFNDDSNMFELD